MHNRSSFFTVLEGERLVPAWSGEGPFLGHNISQCPHVAEGAMELSGISFGRELIPFTRAPPS